MGFGSVGVIIPKTYKYLHIPLISGWTPDHLGSGGIGNQENQRLWVKTGAVANSRGMVHCPMYDLYAGGLLGKVDWSKQLSIAFSVFQQLDVVTGIGRIQLKEANTEGALTASGFGLKVENKSLKGEVYGIADNEIDLGITMADWVLHNILIINTPGKDIKWLVDGSLAGIHTDEPTVPGTTGAHLVLSVINGVTPSDYRFGITPIFGWASF